MKRVIAFFALLALMCVTTAGCSAGGESETGEAPETPRIPGDLEKDEAGVPMLNVYIVETDEIQRMSIEEYLLGVVAGEMKNDWPIEALKAQSILARTFTLKFLSTKESRYEGADISTDVREAQAYNAEKINDNVRKAVEQTRGQVMSYGGELPQAWFHAHSGGTTELPSVALEYVDDPNYLSVIQSAESDAAPESVKNWTVSFTSEQVKKACADSGVQIGTLESFEIGQRGASGRAKTFIVNGSEVSAPSFRINIGATALKSTLIDSISVENGTLKISGRGFGHGVGMSQWGAYELAENGAAANDIVEHYYKDINIVGIWE